MSVKRYVLDENALMGGMEMFEDDDGDYVLHSDYAAFEARHNELREAVAWERECIDTWEYGTALKMQALDEQVAAMSAARAEVDRLLEEQP